MDPAKMKVVDLRSELGALGLDTKGNKPALVERLKKALEAKTGKAIPDTSILDTSAEDADEPATPRRAGPAASLRRRSSTTRPTPAKRGREDTPEIIEEESKSEESSQEPPTPVPAPVPMPEPEVDPEPEERHGDDLYSIDDDKSQSPVSVKEEEKEEPYEVQKKSETDETKDKPIEVKQDGEVEKMDEDEQDNKDDKNKQAEKEEEDIQQPDASAGSFQALDMPLQHNEIEIIVEEEDGIEQPPPLDVAVPATSVPVPSVPIPPAPAPTPAPTPAVPRRSRQSRYRSRPLAPLDEARRILSQVEMQRAASDAATASALQLIGQGIGRLADAATRLADAADRYSSQR